MENIHCFIHVPPSNKLLENQKSSRSDIQYPPKGISISHVPPSVNMEGNPMWDHSHIEKRGSYSDDPPSTINS